MRKKKTGKHNIFFQPMFILDLEMRYKASHEMQTMKEFSVSFTPYNIHSDIKKSVVAIFLGEVLTSVLKEQSSHEEMFDYIEEAIIYFDSRTSDFANFHIAFLAGLSSYLGFEPSIDSVSDSQYFDMKNGAFVPIPPSHGSYASGEISEILANFFSASYEACDLISLNGTIRNEVLETLVKYYSMHLPGLKKIKSLEVLKTVFR